MLFTLIAFARCNESLSTITFLTSHYILRHKVSCALKIPTLIYSPCDCALFSLQACNSSSHFPIPPSWFHSLSPRLTEHSLTQFHQPYIHNLRVENLLLKIRINGDRSTTDTNTFYVAAIITICLPYDLYVLKQDFFGNKSHIHCYKCLLFLWARISNPLFLRSSFLQLLFKIRSNMNLYLL